MKRKVLTFGIIALVVSLAFSTTTYSFAVTYPIASNDSYMINENTLLNIAAPGLLANDTGAAGKILSVGLVSNVKNGTLLLETNGSFIYVPDLDFHGIDTFRYIVNDGSLNSNIANVTITVKQINHAPVATNDAYSVNENSTLVISGHGVLANDTDIDGNTLSAILVSSVSNGSLGLNSNGTFTYVPNTNFYGTDTFTYKANDGVSDSNIATVVITVNKINPNPSPGTNPILQLISQIQNILAKITGLENQITTLQDKNNALEIRVSHLESIISNINGNTGQLSQNNNQTSYNDSEDDDHGKHNNENKNQHHDNGHDD
jgi:regulator of replication initiation timing